MHIDREMFKVALATAIKDHVAGAVDATWEDDSLVVRMDDTTHFRLELEPGVVFMDTLKDRLRERMQDDA